MDEIDWKILWIENEEDSTVEITVKFLKRIHCNHLEETSSREFVNKMKIEKKLASSALLNFPSRDSKILENDGFNDGIKSSSRNLRILNSNNIFIYIINRSKNHLI